MDEIPLPITLNRRILDLENRITELEIVRSSNRRSSLPTMTTAVCSVTSGTWMLVADTTSYFRLANLTYDFTVVVPASTVVEWKLESSVHPYDGVAVLDRSTRAVGTAVYTSTVVLPSGARKDYSVSLYARLFSGTGTVSVYLNSPFSSGVE